MIIIDILLLLLTIFYFTKYRIEKDGRKRLEERYTLLEQETDIFGITSRRLFKAIDAPIKGDLHA